MKKFLLIVITYSLFHTPLFSQGLWSPRTSLPDTARGYGIGFSIGNYGYVGLGYNNSTTFNGFWQFNPSTNMWLKKADFPGQARICPATFVIGHKAWVVTGVTGAIASLNECWEYDATIDKWTQKSNFPGPPRGYDVGFAIGNKGFIGMGEDYGSTTLYKDIWEYDTASDTWTKKNNFGGTVREGATAFAVANKGYICFGQDTSTGWNSDIWEYDTTSDTWTKKTSYPGVGIYAANGFVIGSNIYVGTGQDGNTYNYKYFWKYNTLTDTWTQQANFMGGARGVCSAFAIADSGYFGLGLDSINYNNDWYKFYPDTVTGINELKDNSEEISVFPNPSNGVFTIKNEELGVKNTIEVYNILGERVYGETFSQNENLHKIDLGNMTTGIYTLKVYSLTQTFYKKLLIIH